MVKTYFHAKWQNQKWIVPYSEKWIRLSVNGQLSIANFKLPILSINCSSSPNLIKLVCFFLSPLTLIQQFGWDNLRTLNYILGKLHFTGNPAASSFVKDKSSSSSPVVKQWQKLFLGKASPVKTLIIINYQSMFIYFIIETTTKYYKENNTTETFIVIHITWNKANFKKT